jgi:predicted O-linked N-acetylglucosamine transferase (SPINDLY family)
MTRVDGKDRAIAAQNQATAHHQRGNLAEAERLYGLALGADPANVAALHMLGVLRAQQGRNDEALALIGAALKIAPGAADALVNYGNILNLMGRGEKALASYDKALAINPRDSGTLNNRGNVLRKLGRPIDAVQSYDRALAINPRDMDALYNRGNALWEAGRPGEALAGYEKALTVDPRHVGALNNRGLALWELGRRDEALASYGRALSIKPDFIEALNNRGNALVKLRRFDEALVNYEQSLAAAPNNPGALIGRAGALLALKRFGAALEGYKHAHAANSANLYALGGAFTAALNLCDWQETAAMTDAVRQGIARGDAVIPPFMVLGHSDDNMRQLECARLAIRDRVPEAPPPIWNGAPRHHPKLRIGYMSSDYCQHPVPALIVRLIELHDRSRFEIIGISTGLDDGSAIRARIVKAFDQFHDIRGQGARAAAEFLHQLEIDILVDLNGHTEGDSFEILAHRACPLQVSYLGYPATTGADFIDYVIADAIVAPRDHQPFFTEQIVHLPDTYFATSYQPVMAAPSRAEAGLPPEGFVFCCFNNSWKVTQPMFEAWMRILAAAPDSVLWLLAANDGFRENLRREAQARGIDPWRLIFAERATPEAHLARLGLAGLMLDTLPYTGHMTAADALWMGVPIVTLPGKSFASRVAASLLQAIGLPELVTDTLPAYEALALQLATNPAVLKQTRDTITRNRLSMPLFDTDRLRRHIEAAYTAMWQLQQDGKAPRGFAVPPL